MQLSGVTAHLWQRLSALYLLLYFPYLGWVLGAHAFSFELLFKPLFGSLSFIAVGLIMTHAWIGGRDIMLDYLPQQRVITWLRVYALFLLLVVLDLIWLVTMLEGLHEY